MSAANYRNTFEERLQILREMVSGMESSTNKGFLPSQDLHKFPLISEILPLFMTGNGDDFITGVKSKETYK